MKTDNDQIERTIQTLNALHGALLRIVWLLAVLTGAIIFHIVIS